MDDAEGKMGVGLGAGANVGDAPFVAENVDGVRQAGETERASHQAAESWTFQKIGNEDWMRPVRRVR